MFAFHAALTSFSLNGLTTVGRDLSIWYNDALCHSLVTAFVDAMTALGWSGSVSSSDNDDSC